jgi:hypothetical protein
MPSDDRTHAVLAALASAAEPYRTAVAGAVAQVGAYLEQQRLPADGRAERLRHELGGFAAGRIDADRFATLLAPPAPVATESVAQLERAHHALRHVAGRADTMFATSVPAGRELLVHVAHALAEIGRAFSAARAFELARRGRPGGDELDGFIGGFAFRHWNRAERQIAPPLVVEVDGADAQAASLAEFLDGRQKVVLVIRGGSPPAPLARLLSPGLFVVQAGDPADLGEFAAHDGPAIAALVPEGAARFVHRPGPGPAGARLEVTHLPDAPRVPLGRYSSFQQAEELAVLRALATAPSVAAGPPSPAMGEGTPAEAVTPTPAEPPLPLAGTGPGGGGPSGDPVDRLAAWLLSQVDVTAGA